LNYTSATGSERRSKWNNGYIICVHRSSYAQDMKRTKCRRNADVIVLQHHAAAPEATRGGRHWSAHPPGRDEPCLATRRAAIGLSRHHVRAGRHRAGRARARGPGRATCAVRLVPPHHRGSPPGHARPRVDLLGQTRGGRREAGRRSVPRSATRLAVFPFSTPVHACFFRFKALKTGSCPVLDGHRLQ
jgi:hypothetical protein